MELQVVGYKQLDAALGELPQALRRNVVLAALRKAARPTVRDARSRAPRGKDPKRRGSKKQRRSKKSEGIGAGADSIAARAVRATTATTTTIAIGPDAQHWYLRFSEFGTARSRKQPFLRPAFDGNAERAAVDVGEALWEQLARTAARLAAQASSGKISKGASKALLS